VSEDVLGRWLQHAQSAVAKISVRSALNPILWLCAIVCPLFIVGAYYFRAFPEIRIALVVVAIIPVLVACGVFIGFAIRQPAKLQSEDYQLRHESLRVILQGSGAINLEPAQITALARLLKTGR